MRIGLKKDLWMRLRLNLRYYRLLLEITLATYSRILPPYKILKMNSVINSQERISIPKIKENLRRFVSAIATI